MMTTNQRCRTCKHWGSDSQINACRNPQLNGTCQQLVDGEAGMVISLTTEPRSIIDGPELLTGPDFGCVHWEGKE